MVRAASIVVPVCTSTRSSAGSTGKDIGPCLPASAYSCTGKKSATALMVYRYRRTQRRSRGSAGTYRCSGYLAPVRVIVISFHGLAGSATRISGVFLCITSTTKEIPFHLFATATLTFFFGFPRAVWEIPTTKDNQFSLLTLLLFTDEETI